MLKKVISVSESFYRSFKDWQLFLFLFSIAFFIRFPFFFRDYVDRDESTFILMAQSWVDGHLPYTQLWDLKPPVTFLYFAIVILTFGKSFFAIRLGGVLFVSCTAFFSYKIGHKIGPKKVAFWTALVLVVLQSLFGSLQGVMSEHISMAFFMMGIYLAFFPSQRPRTFLGGLFLGLALMTKLNLGYALLAVFLFVFGYDSLKGNLISSLKSLSKIGLGILIVIMATSLPYSLEGTFTLWWESVFKAPMAYSKDNDPNVLKVLPYVLGVITLLTISFKRGWLHFRSRNIWILVTITGGVLFSFLQTGKANGHYLIQLYPTLVLLVGLVLYNTKILFKANYKTGLLIIALVLPIESYIEITNVLNHKTEKGSFYNGEGIDVPRYFSKNGLSSKNVLFFEYHIGYWLLNTLPPTKAATHPSNILREAVFPYMRNGRKTAGEELQFLLEKKKPDYIITRKNRRVFDKKMYKANFYVQLQLLENYHPLDTIDKAVIHKRLKVD